MPEKPLDEVVDDILTYMSLSDQAKERSNERVALSYFNEAEPYMPSLVDNVIELTPSGHEYFSPNVITNEELLAAPIDVSLLIEYTDSSPSGYDKYAFRRIKSVTSSSIRGRVQRFSSHPWEETVAGIRSDGTYVSGRNYYGLLGGKVTNLGRTDGGGAPVGDKSNDDFVRMARSIQLNRPYAWRVILGYELMATISFTTDPTGAKEVFRLRDIPEGKKRRAALKHWVTEHWRKKNDGEDEVRVREHLRGAATFHWNGLFCQIRPSEFDLEKAAKAKK